MSICAASSQQWWVVLCAGRDRVAEATKVRLLPVAHHLKVQRLLAERTLRWWVGLQLQTRLLPCVHQPLWRWKGNSRSQFNLREKATVGCSLQEIRSFNCNMTLWLLNYLTNKVFHHLRGVVRGWSNAKKLLPSSNSGIVDRLHIDVVAIHHDVTNLCVFLSIRHLKQSRHIWLLGWSR